MPYLSVIIPTIDRHEVLLKLLKKLEHQTCSDFELVIVDSSKTRSVELESYVRSKPTINYIRFEKRSLPAARNVGALSANGQVLLFIDDDVDPDNDLFRAHVENYSSADISGVAGKVTGGYDRQTSGPVGKIRAIDAKIFRNFTGDSKCSVDHMPGGNMSIRKVVFEQVGGFDKNFRGSFDGEETDFCLRARRLKFNFVYEPKAVVFHKRHETGGIRQSKFSTYLYWNAHNVTLFSFRHCPWWSLIPIVISRMMRFSLYGLLRGDLGLVCSAFNGIVAGVLTYSKAKV